MEDSCLQVVMQIQVAEMVATEFSDRKHVVSEAYITIGKTLPKRTKCKPL